MFCPKCKSEFREGFSRCSRCEVALISDLPSSTDTKVNEVVDYEFIDYELIYSTFNPGEVALIKSLLESENITYFISGENLLYVPLFEPAKVLIKKDQAMKAREILSAMAT
ncbi:putative signal transducing protein [Desulforamulus aeronauticus]|uniref:Putative signal transducing protein n=1 Tax=Desulforamulus aeronauticus DSM 10349 TaxID=1121421 RepID=A0A1M6QAB4_9FIRM|nr:DUF2007 domain-containing protein [Desulforamulus aeronauticus]SHK17219.1 Putative signal transducing protein [Desulforamulus aeronauticus DSM 10349]